MGLLRTISDVCECVDELANIRCDDIILHSKYKHSTLSHIQKDGWTYFFTETTSQVSHAQSNNQQH